MESNTSMDTEPVIIIDKIKQEQNDSCSSNSSITSVGEKSNDVSLSPVYPAVSSTAQLENVKKLIKKETTNDEHVVIKQEVDIQDDYEVQDPLMDPLMDENSDTPDQFVNLPRILDDVTFLCDSLFEVSGNNNDHVQRLSISDENLMYNDTSLWNGNISEDISMNYDSDCSIDSRLSMWDRKTSCISASDSYPSIHGDDDDDDDDDEDDDDTFFTTWANDMQKLDDWPEDRKRDILMEIYSSIDSSFCNVKKNLSSMFNLSFAELHRIRLMRRQIKNRIYAKTSRRRKIKRLKMLMKDLSQVKTYKQKLFQEKQYLLNKKYDLEEKCKKIQMYIFGVIRARSENVAASSISTLEEFDENTRNLLRIKLMEEKSILEDRKQLLVSKYNKLCSFLFNVLSRRYAESSSNDLQCSISAFDKDHNNSNDSFVLENCDNQVDNTDQHNLISSRLKKKHKKSNSIDDMNNIPDASEFVLVIDRSNECTDNDTEMINEQGVVIDNSDMLDVNIEHQYSDCDIKNYENTVEEHFLLQQDSSEKEEKRRKKRLNNKCKISKNKPLLISDNSSSNERYFDSNIRGKGKEFNVERNSIGENVVEPKDIDEHFNRSLQKYSNPEQLENKSDFINENAVQQIISNDEMDIEQHFKRSLEKYNNDERLKSKIYIGGNFSGTTSKSSNKLDCNNKQNLINVAGDKLSDDILEDKNVSQNSCTNPTYDEPIDCSLSSHKSIYNILKIPQLVEGEKFIPDVQGNKNRKKIRQILRQNFLKHNPAFTENPINGQFNHLKRYLPNNNNNEQPPTKKLRKSVVPIFDNKRLKYEKLKQKLNLKFQCRGEDNRSQNSIISGKDELLSIDITMEDESSQMGKNLKDKVGYNSGLQTNESFKNRDVPQLNESFKDQVKTQTNEMISEFGKISSINNDCNIRQNSPNESKDSVREITDESINKPKTDYKILKSMLQSSCISLENNIDLQTENRLLFETDIIQQIKLQSFSNQQHNPDKFNSDNSENGNCEIKCQNETECRLQNLSDDLKDKGDKTYNVISENDTQLELKAKKVLNSPELLHDHDSDFGNVRPEPDDILKHTHYFKTSSKDSVCDEKIENDSGLVTNDSEVIESSKSGDNDSQGKESIVLNSDSIQIIEKERINVLQHFTHILPNSETEKVGSTDRELLNFNHNQIKSKCNTDTDKCSLQNFNTQVKLALHHFDQSVINYDRKGQLINKHSDDKKNDSISLGGKEANNEQASDGISLHSNTDDGKLLDSNSDGGKVLDSNTDGKKVLDSNTDGKKFLDSNTDERVASDEENDIDDEDDLLTDDDSESEDGLDSADTMKLKKQKLLEERDCLVADKKRIEEKYLRLYKHIFQPLGFQNGSALLRLYLSYSMQLLNIPGIDIFDPSSQLNKKS